jgi:hypothetical protein
MKRLRLVGTAFLVPALAFLVIGCGGGDKKTDGGASADNKASDSGKPKPGAGKGKTELESTGTGSLVGVVVFDGTAPTPADYKETREDFKTHPDRKVCEMGDTREPTWRVNADSKGVENVVVWVAPPAGKYFKKPEDKSWPDEVVIHQPHCAFEPHVAVAYPGRFDYKTKKPDPSGQKFIVNNEAPMKHNTAVRGSPDKNPEVSKTLEAGDKKGIEFSISPDSEPIMLRCDIHKWMTGYVWAFDHPYATVTDKDGKFEIKNVPAGADVDIYYWHESMGKTPQKLTKQAPKKLMAGENKEEIKLSGK